MKTSCLHTILLIFFVVSCGGKQESVKNNLSSSKSAESIDSVSVETATIDEAQYRGSFTLAGVPENTHRVDRIAVSVDSFENISSVQYAVVTGPCLDAQQYVTHTDLLSPFTVDLKNFHSDIQLCVKATDDQGIESLQAQTFTWRQGYPELMNKALVGPCINVGNGIFTNERRQVEFAHSGAGEAVTVTIFQKRYPNDFCSGGSSDTAPLAAESFTFTAASLNLTVGANSYQIKVAEDLTDGFAATSGFGWNFPEDRDFTVVELGQ